MNYKTHRNLAWHAAEYVRQTRERFAIAKAHNAPDHQLDMFANAVERAVKAQRDLRNTKISNFA